MLTRRYQLALGAALLSAAGMGCTAFGANNGSQGQDSSNRAAGQQNEAGNSSGNASGNSSANAQNQNNQNNPKAPEGFVIFEEKAVYLMANEPQAHFTRAVEDLSQNNKQAAAAEVGIAADYLDMLAGADKQSDKQDLHQCADKLRTDAKDIRSGKVSSPQDLASDFSKAQLSLASDFQEQAKQYLGNNKDVRAGHDLTLSATALQDALLWKNQKPQQQDISAIQDAMQAGSRLITASNNSSGQQGDHDNDADDRGQNGRNQQSNYSAQGNENRQQANAGQQQVDPQKAVSELGNCINNAQQQTASNHD